MARRKRPPKPDAAPHAFDMASIRSAVRSFLEAAGLDPDDEALAPTPAKVAEAWTNAFLDGYLVTPDELFSEAYPVPEGPSTSRLVLLKDLTFHGMCPHHLLPYHGRAHLAYVPGKKLASLSALARLVDCYAHRLEIQETVTRQIAEALLDHLGARGAGVYLSTDQSCLTMRGVERKGTSTVTQHYVGSFAKKGELRSEFLASIAASG